MNLLCGLLRKNSVPSAVKKEINRKVLKGVAKYAIKNNDYEQNRN